VALATPPYAWLISSLVTPIKLLIKASTVFAALVYAEATIAIANASGEINIGIVGGVESLENGSITPLNELFSQQFFSTISAITAS
jgi:hypothetical protein